MDDAKKAFLADLENCLRESMRIVKQLEALSRKLEQYKSMAKSLHDLMDKTVFASLEREEFDGWQLKAWNRMSELSYQYKNMVKKDSIP